MHEKQISEAEKYEKKNRTKLMEVPRGTTPDACRAQGTRPRRSDWRTN